MRDENQRLQAEINRLKGMPGEPKSKANKAETEDDRATSSDYSSEKERRQAKKRNKQSKNDKIEIDREEVLKVDPETLPDDAEFKGYEDVIVQDIKVETDNIRFRKEKYYSPSQNKVYIAPLPTGYEGQFGPVLKFWVIVMYFSMTIPSPINLSKICRK